MRKLILAILVLPLLCGVALAKGPGHGGHGGHGGPSPGVSGPGNGGVQPGDLGPLAGTDWRVQWVLQHQLGEVPLAGPGVQQGPTT